MSGRSSADLIRDIPDALAEIGSFTDGMDPSAFTADLKTLRAVELEFIIIGEAASKIPDDIQQTNPQIPWGVMKAMRNRLVHAYFSVDPNILWETVRNDLPPLESELRSLANRTP